MTTVFAGVAIFIVFWIGFFQGRIYQIRKMEQEDRR